MSLTKAVVVGSALGAAAALGVYAASATPSVSRPVAAKGAPAPVVTPTVTTLARCTAPAVLEKGVCVTRVPGRVVVLPAAAPAPARPKASNRAPATKPPTTRPPSTTRPSTRPTEEPGEHETEREHEHETEHGHEGEGPEGP